MAMKNAQSIAAAPARIGSREVNVSKFLHQAGRVLATAGLVGCTISAGHAQQITASEYQTNINVQVLPFAMLDFIDSPLLALTIPPAVSTIPAKGVRFRVTGNASATMTAEPSAFIYIEGERFMGRADLNGESVGYKLELRFPAVGILGSPPQYAALPGFTQGATVPPLSVDLTMSAGQRDGVLHMEASHQWTEDGGLPRPGVYVGNVTLTLTADY
jgi:hypothetical protein